MVDVASANDAAVGDPQLTITVRVDALYELMSGQADIAKSALRTRIDQCPCALEWIVSVVPIRHVSPSLKEGGKT